tara:strand:+ start:665 stop:1327 length:663 start_codon:yes stop_codon:yes gene_type:complete
MILPLAYTYYPWLLKIDLSDLVTDELNDELAKQCIDSDKKERPKNEENNRKNAANPNNLNKNSYNTLMDTTKEMKYLYDIFNQKIHKYFSNLPDECKSENPHKGLGYAYVSYGKKRYDSYWHNHCNRATINSVYYVKVPDSNGVLGLLWEDGEERKLKPLEKHLYLMPGWLSHKPYPCDNEDPRISINMEFLSETRAILKPENFPTKLYEDWDKGALIVW